MARTAAELARPVRRRRQLEALHSVRIQDIVLPKFRGTGLDLAERIVGGEIERTIDGASVLTLVIDDADRALIRSGRLNRTADVRLDGLWFLLIGLRKTGNRLELEFEDRDIAVMRTYTSYRQARRSKLTRAQFARRLVREVREREIPFISPELRIRQPIARESERLTDGEREDERDYGFGNAAGEAAGWTVKGSPPSRIQVRNAERVLDVGRSLGARRKVMITSMMVVIQESNLINVPAGQGDLDSVGLFQQRPSQGWPATGVPETDAAEFFRRAIAADERSPGLQLWALAQEVQRSAFPRAYNDWLTEGQDIVEEYGAGDDVGEDVERTIPYVFTRGQPGEPEDTWTALGRLAEEVGWRRFMVAGACYFMSDQELLRSSPRATISEDSDGVNSIDCDYEHGTRHGHVTVKANLRRWGAPPGSVLKIRELGPLNGKWLVESIRHGLFTDEGTVELIRPEPRLPEPAPEVETVRRDRSNQFGLEIRGGTLRENIVAVAEEALSRASDYTYRQHRPYPPRLFSRAALNSVDCSSFFILCYKEAGAGDPNETNFDGFGNTYTLVTLGRWTNDPRPGDAAFYGPGGSVGVPYLGTARRVPEHVAVYIGNDSVISFGSTPIRKFDTVRYRDDFQGFMTFPRAIPAYDLPVAE